MEDGKEKYTFFIDHPAVEGNPIIFLFIDSIEQTIERWVGFCVDESVKFTKKLLEPTPIFTIPLDEFSSLHELNIEHPAKKITDSVHEIKALEYKYSYSLERTFIIIDVENGKAIEPEFSFKDKEIRGSIFLKPFKYYFVFEISSDNQAESFMGNYELGLAYRYGFFRLNQNRKKAYYYFSKAAKDGDERAKKELRNFMMSSDVKKKADKNKLYDIDDWKSAVGRYLVMMIKQ